MESEDNAQKTINAGGEHSRRNTAQRKLTWQNENDGHAEVHEVLSAEGDVQKQKVDRLVDHLEEGGQGQQKVGGAMQVTWGEKGREIFRQKKICLWDGFYGQKVCPKDILKGFIIQLMEVRLMTNFFNKKGPKKEINQLQISKI